MKRLPLNNGDKSPRTSAVIPALVGLFIIAATAIAAIPGLNYVVKALGVVLAMTYAFRTLVFRTGFLVTPELILYFCWLVWSLSSVLTGTDLHSFWLSWQGIIQIWILILILSSFVVTEKNLSFNLVALLMGALVVAAYSYGNGEFRRVYVEGGRVQGLLGNANSFAWTMLLAVMCMAHFWMLEWRFKNLLRIALGGGFALAGMAIILSASRKATLGVLLFFPVWIWFCYRREALKRYRLLFGILASLGLGALLLYFFMQDKTLANRFDAVRYDFRDNVRIYLYMEAADIIRQNPVFGVGLNNFWRFSRWGLPAHSEYAEVAASTGIPGLLIYLSIFLVLWRRAGKIAKHAKTVNIAHIAQLIRAVLVVVMILNLGTWNYSSKISWILFASFIGWSSSTWKRINIQAKKSRSKIDLQTEENIAGNINFKEPQHGFTLWNWV